MSKSSTLKKKALRDFSNDRVILSNEELLKYYICYLIY